MKLYRVLGWDEHFENSKSRERKDCSFVCVPNSQSGLGFSRIMARKDGAAVYGIWCLLLGALSRQSRVDKSGRDGYLTQDGHPTGTPWTVEDLALLWRRPEPEIANALSVFESPSIRWIKSEEVSDTQQEALTARQLPANCPHGIVKEGKKEEKEGKARASSQNELEDFCFSLGLPRSDGEWLWFKWNASNWKNGGKKIEDWKGTIRSWKLAGYMTSQKKNGYQPKQIDRNAPLRQAPPPQETV